MKRATARVAGRRPGNKRGQTPEAHRNSTPLAAVLDGQPLQPRQKDLQLVVNGREQDRVIDPE
jgi:hypothetical protein